MTTTNLTLEEMTRQREETRQDFEAGYLTPAQYLQILAEIREVEEVIKAESIEDTDSFDEACSIADAAWSTVKETPVPATRNTDCSKADEYRRLIATGGLTTEEYMDAITWLVANEVSPTVRPRMPRPRFWLLVAFFTIVFTSAELFVLSAPQTYFTY